MATRNEAPNSTFSNESGNQFVAATFTADNITIGGATKDCHEEELLAKLPYAENATFDHYNRQGDPLCMENTRTQVLDDIMAWARSMSESDAAHTPGRVTNSGSVKRIYWLNGMAGTGKSTIARTVARRCHDEGRLGASFFFSRGGGELETARMFVTSIAAQLASKPGLLRKHICDAVAAHPKIATKSLSDQWKELVLRPLSRLDAAAGEPPLPLVVIIDALDECSDEREIEFVLRLLSETSGLGVLRLRIFLTSRPEILIREGIQDIPEAQRQHLILHRIDQEVVDHDIRVFLEQRLGKIIRRRPSRSAGPSGDTLQQLVERASGLFIWAATTCHFVTQGRANASKRLDLILRDGASSTSTHPQTRLDEIYHHVLQNSLREAYSQDENDELCSVLRTVLGTVAVLFSSFSAPSLAALLNLTEAELVEVLCDLHAIFDVPDEPHLPIRPQHASVRDFLLDSRRCTDARFCVTEHLAHSHVAQQCLRLLNDSLRRDICRLRTLGAFAKDVPQDVIHTCVLPHLRYACLYWVRHVERSHNMRSLEATISIFMKQHYLHWLEALSLLGRLADGVELMAILEALCDEESYLRAMAADAKRFLLYNKQMIEEAPLQSYLSAILFAPTKSLIRSLYCGELPQWLSQRPVIRENWSQELLSLEGHADGVIGVSFSSDSRLLASASSDKTIRIWDVKTGRARSILKGHSGPVRAVAFSPNGRLLVSASADETLSLWDVETGGKRETLKGHSDTVYDVAFSPDARCIASVSADGKVKLWGVTDGRARVTPYSVPGTVKAIAFMRDGQRLACATAGGHVKLLDVTTGGIICDMLEGDSKLLAPLANYRYHKPEKWVTSAAFSPDGQLLASESKDKSVWLWDCRTRSVLGIFENHLQLKAVAISPNLRRLATAYSDRTIVLWDLTTGSPCNTLECHSVPNAVAFSPHGRLLASALQDKTVKLWDVTTDSAPRMVEGHPQTLTSAVFSPDGQFFAAVLRKNTVAVWDATTGAACGSLGGHSGSVTSVAFSPDNQLLAYASSDHTVRLWHHASETLLHVYHSAYVHWLKFSANGTSIETDNDLIPLHLPPRPAVVSNVHVPALRFAFEDNWLTCNSENLLWLPHEYRPETLVTHNNRIALVLRSHRIIFLAFDFGNGQELK